MERIFSQNNNIMKLNLNFWTKSKEAIQTSVDPVRGMVASSITAFHSHATGSFAKRYTGEKNLGELGPPIHYVLSYWDLRVRSWQSFLESDLSQAIIKKYCAWIIGPGLKLDADPAVELLKSEGITFDSERLMMLLNPDLMFGPEVNLHPIME